MPFLNPDLELRVDGSSSYLNGNRAMSHSVTPVNEAVEASPLSPKLSTQAAEWIALTKTCQPSKEKAVNIYTDSWYGFGACCATGQLWKKCGCITSIASEVLNC